MRAVKHSVPFTLYNKVFNSPSKFQCRMHVPWEDPGVMGIKKETAE